MPRNMLDATFCIRLPRDRPQGLRPRFTAEAETLCISTITLTELLHGAARLARPVENRRAVEGLVGRLVVLALDEDAAAHAGEIHADLARRGQLIGPFGILIAGHARSRGLVVITGNLGEFQHVDGVRAEDWLAPT
ncbi:PIN domain-containing protein [Dankookia rubra]|uniref:Ribonuclease VapC n=1 Tax=Dankookia rubra TaxID=1442381 RepID=A0A4R5QBN6_9PROT|nr:PIN domain-containing protein [Dankookia rubra]TDH60153.1 PIN domain-containing protein [Dankookia rubra]